MIRTFVLGLGIFAAGASQPQPQAPSATPAPEAPVPLAQSEARQVVATLADLVERNYVFPDIAARYAAALRQKAASGGYDGAATNVALAEALTADLRAISPDNHLRVRAGETGPGGPRMVRRAPGSPAPAGAPMRVRPQAIESA